MNEEQCRKEYDDWIELLRKRGALELLDNPYNVWLEAWSVATVKLRNAPTS